MSPSARALAIVLAERLTTRLPLAGPLQRVHDECEAATGACASVVALTTGLFDPALHPAWLDGLWPATRLILASVASGLGADRDVRREVLQEARPASVPRDRSDRSRAGPVAAGDPVCRVPLDHVGPGPTTAGDAIHRGGRPGSSAHPGSGTPDARAGSVRPQAGRPPLGLPEVGATPLYLWPPAHQHDHSSPAEPHRCVWTRHVN